MRFLTVVRIVNILAVGATQKITKSFEENFTSEKFYAKTVSVKIFCLSITWAKVMDF